MQPPKYVSIVRFGGGSGPTCVARVEHRFLHVAFYYWLIVDRLECMTHSFWKLGSLHNKPFSLLFSNKTFKTFHGKCLLSSVNSAPSIRRPRGVFFVCEPKFSFLLIKNNPSGLLSTRSLPKALSMMGRDLFSRRPVLIL